MIGLLPLLLPLLLFCLYLIINYYKQVAPTKAVVACEVYCNDSRDGEYSLDEISSSKDLYCHVNVTKGYKDYRYKLYFSKYIDDKLINQGEKYGYNLLRKGDSMVHHMEADEIKTGKYKIVFKLEDSKKDLCSAEINVVDK